MKVTFYIDVVDDMKYAKAKSDLVVEGCDLCDLLLSGDLSSIESVQEFEKTVFDSKEVWWFNASKVTPENDIAVIQAAFDISAEAKIEMKALKALVKNWKQFLKDKRTLTINV